MANCLNRSSAHRQRVAIHSALIAVLILIIWPAESSLSGQVNSTPQHYLYDSTMPPGTIGQLRLLARQAMVGYSQAVKLVVPPESKVEVFSSGSFQSSAQAPTVVGMMVGHVYRLKITGIPQHPGKEVFPSVEIISRLYPPQGRETECPVPVHIPIEDLELALKGLLVTRVIYLEDPENALPEQQSEANQPYFDVGLGDDPIRVAEKFGRPMAIVRLGSRVPDNEELNGFGFGTPPLKWFSANNSERNGADPADSHQTQNSKTVIRPVGYPQPTLATTAPQLCGRCGRQNCAGCANHPTIQSAPLTLPPAVQQPTQLPPPRDELLFDGGDRRFKATVSDQFKVRGLDSQDTIGHFDTLDGRRIVDESNRVAIYAPRFAAVRKVDGLGHTRLAQQTGRLDEPLKTKSSRRADFSSTTLQNLQATRHRSTRISSGLETQTRGVLVDNTTMLKLFDGKFKTFENFRLIRHGFFDNNEKGRLAIAIARANTWNNNLTAKAALSNLQLIVVGNTRSAKEAVHVKTEANRPKLRLVKVASTDLAHSGDTVEFTIRFDNVGDQEIGNVTIIDDLTTRLVYIPDSAQCNLTANFLASENDVHSQTLRWEIEDPLGVGKGGVIRFKCRVR